MSKFEVVYSTDAQKCFQTLDRSIAQRIYLKIDFYISTPNPLDHAKTLSGELGGLYRFRVGDYRVIFSVDKDGSVTVLTILRVAHRKDIYK
jgi:mRNA interferase RelE/StbE